MIEKGKFYRAGLMKDIDPGNPSSMVPYYIRVQEGDAIPEGEVTGDGSTVRNWTLLMISVAHISLR